MAYCNPEKKGAAANPNGRPKGKTRTTCIREALKNIAIDDSEQSLEDFCRFIKKTEPVEFFKAWIKLSPQKIESDNRHTVEISDADKLIIQRLIGKNND